jgi:hypothetical protein
VLVNENLSGGFVVRPETDPMAKIQRARAERFAYFVVSRGHEDTVAVRDKQQQASTEFYYDHLPVWGDRFAASISANLFAATLGEAIALASESEGGPLDDATKAKLKVSQEAGFDLNIWLPESASSVPQWTFFPRAELFSVITQDVTQLANPMFRVKIPLIDVQRWRRLLADPAFTLGGSRVTVRSRSLGGPFVHYTLSRVDPDSLVFDVVQTKPIARGDVVLFDRTFLDALTAPERVLETSVMTDKASQRIRAAGPFRRHRGDCKLADHHDAFPPADPDGARWDARTVGAYEGGFGRNCGVFRPCGRCVMRRGAVRLLPIEAEAFCYVCKYLLVNAFDPSLLVALDEWNPARP